MDAPIVVGLFVVGGLDSNETKVAIVVGIVDVGNIVVTIVGGVEGTGPTVALKIKLLRLVLRLEPNRSLFENGIGVGRNEVVVVAKLLLLVNV